MDKCALTVQSGTPHGCEHDGTESHDEGVLNHTETPTDPVTLDTDKDLTTDNADNPVIMGDRNCQFPDPFQISLPCLSTSRR